jgi:hypothetical protein
VRAAGRSPLASSLPDGPLLELDWRLHELTIMLVLELTETQHVEERDIEERDART